jgi:hypothetical protein
MTKHSLSYLEYLVERGISGCQEDVDFLMHVLARDNSIALIKQVDYALGHVRSWPGRERICQYLFAGEPIQRNYAALYFKRAGHNDLLEQAFKDGKIDADQAFAV